MTLIIFDVINTYLVDEGFPRCFIWLNGVCGRKPSFHVRYGICSQKPTFLMVEAVEGFGEVTYW